MKRLLTTALAAAAFVALGAGPAFADDVPSVHLPPAVELQGDPYCDGTGSCLVTVCATCLDPVSPHGLDVCIGPNGGPDIGCFPAPTWVTDGLRTYTIAPPLHI